MDPLFAGTAAGAIEVFGQVKDALVKGTDIARKAGRYTAGGSLVSITASARVEPIVILDADCINLPVMPDLMQSLLSIFSGYYLMAIDATTRINNVSIAERLAPLNPNRKIGMEQFDFRMAEESYKNKLPTKKANGNSIALEAAEFSTDKDAVKTIYEATNLSVGKIINVTVRENEQNACVKVSIRLMANVLPSSGVVHLMTVKGAQEIDSKERYHAWRSGNIRGIQDLIFCSDIIKKHRNAIINDKSGVLSNITKRSNDSIKAGLYNKNPSLAIASNMLVVSSTTVDDAALELGGDFSKMKIRNLVFEGTNLMIIAVIEKGWDRVTFYFNGINESASVSYNELKTYGKDKGTDIAEILKMFMSGGAPNL